MREYVELTREIAMFNYSMREIMLVLDLMMKYSCAQCLVYFSKQQDQLSMYSIIIGAMICAFFLHTQLIYSQMSYFPSQNLVLYKRWSGWLAGLCRDGRSTRIIRRWCRAGWFVQSVGDNQLGFSSGSIWFITKWQCIEVFLCNLGLLTLYYKEMVV
mgnify:CR=1 FL=1